MASELRVNSSTNRSGLGTITYTDSGPIVSGVGTFANGLTVNGTQTTVKSLKLTGDNYNVNWFKTTNKLRFNDNAKATFGTADDLSIYHDGSHSILNDSQGSLLLRSNIVQISTPAGSKYFKGQSGAAELYYSDSIKFTTTNTGATVTGDIAASGNVSCVNLNPTGNLKLLDSTAPDYIGNLYIGNSNDFKLFHNGSENFIRSGPGNANIRIDNNSGVLGAKFVPGGAAELYHNGTKRLETFTSGANVIGNLDVINGHVYINDNYKAYFGTNNDLEIFHNDDDAYVRNNKGALILRNNGQSGDADQSQIYIQATPAENSIQCSPNGAVTLYHDNAVRLATTSTGTEITGTLVRHRSAGTVTHVIGSTDSSGAVLALDGDSDGNAVGADYSYIEHSSTGDLNIVQDNPASGGKIEIYTGGAGRLSIQSDKFRPANNEGMTLGTSGLRWGNVYTSGVLFGGDTAAANTLDDYEEGSWSPDIVISNGTSVVSAFAWRTGKYTKVGNLVHCTFAMGLNGINSGSSLRLGGIPFAPAGITYFYYFVLHGYSYASGFGDSDNTTRLFGEVNASLGSQIQIVKGTGRNTVSNSDIGTGQRFTGMFHYYTA